MHGLAVGKVAEGTTRLRAEAGKRRKIFKASALKSDVLSLAVLKSFVAH